MIQIVLPAFNEGERIATLLGEIHETMGEAGLEYRVLLVNDGSTDDTVAQARSMEGTVSLHLLDREENLGFAATVKEGLVHSLAELDDRDAIVTMDADNTHSPGLILPMFWKLREGYDVVIASRYVPGARVVGLSGTRRFLSWAGNLLFRSLLPLPGVRDFTSGFRAYRCGSLRRVAEELGEDFFTETGFTCMPDILLKLRGRGLLLAEVPLLLRYDWKAGASKMNVQSTTLASLRLLFRRRLGWLR